MSDLSNVQREIEAEARRLFPGAVRQVEWLRHGGRPRGGRCAYSLPRFLEDRMIWVTR